MPIDTSWSLASVVKKISQNVTSLIFPIHPLKHDNLRISHMLVNLLLQAPNASVATASTAAERSSLTSWSNCPASTTLAARTWATATSAAHPRETQRRRALAATRIQTQRQPRPQPHLGLARDSWPAASVGWKSPSSSSCLPRFSFSESKSDLGNEQWSSSSIQPRWFWESQVIFYKKAVFIEVTFANSGSWWCGCDQMGGRREATHIKRFTDNDVQIWRLSRSKVQERKETSDI